MSIQYKGWKFEFDHLPSAEELEDRYQERVARLSNRAVVLGAEQGALSGTFPLSPMQRWFFAQPLQTPEYWNHGIVYPAPSGPTAEHWCEAWEEMLRRHDALRLRFQCTDGEWEQSYSALLDAESFESLDFREEPDPNQKLTEYLTRLHREINLEGGIARFAFVLLPDGPDKLVIVVHHLAISGFCWPILAADLLDAAATLSKGDAIESPDKGTSLRYWASELASTEASPESLQYWLDGPWDRASFGLPKDREGSGVEGNVAVARLKVPLTQQFEVKGLEIDVVAVTAVVSALWEWTGSDVVAISLEAHARTERLVPDTDVTRTLGWFSTMYPALFINVGMPAPFPVVRAQLERIPKQTLRYAQARYGEQSDPSARTLRARPEPALLFNSFGKLVGTEAQRIVSDIGLMRAAENQRTHEHEVYVFFDDVDVHVVWVYSNETHDDATIARVMDGVSDVLQKVVKG